jgi:hypothetical protein
MNRAAAFQIVTDADVAQANEDSVPLATKKSEKWAWDLWCNWLLVRNLTDDPVTMTKDAMNQLLPKFILGAVKADGNQYTAGSLKCLVFSLIRYRARFPTGDAVQNWDIEKDAELRIAYGCLKTRLKDLAINGKAAIKAKELTFTQIRSILGSEQHAHPSRPLTTHLHPCRTAYLWKASISRIVENGGPDICG